MNLFFGKISKKYDEAQITEGYYKATRESSWFNGIKPGDYSFIIGGGKIQLWKAKEWRTKSGEDILRFDIIHNDLGINTKKLSAIKYFKITMELAVLSVRSTAKSRKAFFPIKYTPSFSEDMLKDINTYKKEDTYRKIHILSSKDKPDSPSDNIQLYKKDDVWQLYASEFIDSSITNSFHDNTPMLGCGQINKDKTISKVIDPKYSGKKIPPNDLSVLQLYDLFCCNYRSKEIIESSDLKEIDESSDESDFDAVLRNESNIILYGPPGTGKTYEVLSLIEDLKTDERGVQIKPMGNLNLSKTFWHLAPGRNGYLWDEFKKNTQLGYEWCGKEFGDLSKLDSVTENYYIRRRFSQVKQGDYFCIIRGWHCLGIAEALEDYSFEKAKLGPFDFQTVQIKWLGIFDIPILLNATSTPTFSGISGGQRWNTLCEGLIERGFSFDTEKNDKPIFKKLFEFTTFHQSYSYEDFIEGIKPRLPEDKIEDESGQAPEIEYEMKSGIFYQACDRAAQLAGYSDLQGAIDDKKENRENRFSKAQPFYLVIDEINRGNVANIFGELITLIEKDKRLGEEQETIVKLPYSKNYFGVPANLILIGTMNTADRSIEALDSALRRRFTFVEKAPNSEILRQAKYPHIEVDLKLMLETINNRIEILLDKEHLIGHSYFMNIKNLNDIQMAFKNKIIPLLAEYFYGKPQMIGLILGPSFINVKEQVNLFDEFETPYSDFTEKKSYEITIPDNWQAYKAIYGGN
ncbi:MAG: AAA family ATPase [Spirochaetia bacterium]|nr:AAA family ATPase [Spirochaetia bacterium]